MNPLSVHGANMRTTSSLESLNSQLNRTFGRAHPNIFEFIEHLKLHEAFKSNIMLAKTTSVTKEQLEPRRKRDKERNLKIEFFTEKFANNEISVVEFLTAMANKDILPKNCMDPLYKYLYYSICYNMLK